MDPIIESVIVLASGRAHPVTHTIKTHIWGEATSYPVLVTSAEKLRDIFKGWRGQGVTSAAKHVPFRTIQNPSDRPGPSPTPIFEL
jgi:hypothetical protein